MNITDYFVVFNQFQSVQIVLGYHVDDLRNYKHLLTVNSC